MTDLYQTLDILKSDAEQLAQGLRDYIGVIKLEPDWEEQIPRLIHRYEKEIKSIYNSFMDPHGEDEVAWVDAHYGVTMNFLIKHGLATEIDEKDI